MKWLAIHLTTRKHIVNLLEMVPRVIRNVTIKIFPKHTLCRPGSVRYLRADNLIIRAGYLQNVPVSIGGTTWKPDMPTESQIKEEMAEIGQIENPTDRALTMMLYLVRKQMFLDSSKRTSMLAGNHVMISNGCGIISVPIELQPAFTDRKSVV